MLPNPKYALAVNAPELENSQFPGYRTAISGYRFYSPNLGRFINRDPLEEQGGVNLYGFCLNHSVNAWDLLGQDPEPAVWREVASGIWVQFGGDSSSGSGHVSIMPADIGRVRPDFSAGLGNVPVVGVYKAEESAYLSRTWGSTTSSSSSGSALSPFTVTYHSKSGVTTGTTDNQVVSLSDRDGNSATINRDSAQWEFSSDVAPTVPVGVLGNGALGMYTVHGGGGTGSSDITVTPTNTVTTATGFVNGITGSLASHADLGFQHLKDLSGSADYTLFNIPTAGFSGDVFNVGLQKLGIDTPASSALAGVLQSVTSSGNNVQWVAHSGGGAAFAQAMNYAMANGSGPLTGNSVRFDAGANNASVTNGIARAAGVNVTGYYYSPLDFVPNVVGGNGNPISMLASTVLLPTLFIGPPLSQHTKPTSTWSMHRSGSVP